MDIIIATSNSGKLKELQAILAPLSLHCIPQTALNIPSPEETGLTFVENALIKARNACTLSGKPALADDSGLVVPALHGAPGIFSARYAGPDATDQQRYEKLLSAMDGLEGQARHAFYVCALAYMDYPEDPAPIVAQGCWHGWIRHSPAGHGGFGYDPIVQMPGFECSVAELDAEVKNAHSHRAKAIQLFFEAFSEKSSSIRL